MARGMVKHVIVGIIADMLPQLKIGREDFFIYT